MCTCAVTALECLNCFSPYVLEEVIWLVGALIVSYIVVLWRGADVRACG